MMADDERTGNPAPQAATATADVFAEANAEKRNQGDRRAQTHEPLGRIAAGRYAHAAIAAGANTCGRTSLTASRQACWPSC